VSKAVIRAHDSPACPLRRDSHFRNVAATLSDAETALVPAQPRYCSACGGTRLVYRELHLEEPTPMTPGQDSS
jgi:hypothetical protein